MNLRKSPTRETVDQAPDLLEVLNDRVEQGDRVFKQILTGEIPGYCLVEKYWEDLEEIIKLSGNLVASRKVASGTWQQNVIRWRQIQQEVRGFLENGEIFEQRIKPADKKLVADLEAAIIAGQNRHISARILDLYTKWLGRNGQTAQELLGFHERVDYPDLIENLQAGRSHRRLPIKLGQGDLFALVLKNEMDGFHAYVSNTAWNVLHEFSQNNFLEKKRADERASAVELKTETDLSARALRKVLGNK